MLKPIGKKALLADWPLAIVIAVAAFGLCFGWRSFWFLCDDAFIGFRYVSSSILGHGYTWNPPPWKPVEGYTSLLWIALLDGVWRLFGVAPPESANAISLAFSFGTLAVATAMTLQIRLGKRLAPMRTALVALVLLGTLTNRTFLAWTSSGLETAMFGFLLLSWLYLAAFGDADRPAWAPLFMAVAALLALARPDGLLFVAAAIPVLLVRGRLSKKPRALLALLPLVVVAAHLVWRHARYGFWLPNTYYAKFAGASPESGARYLLCFVLEYALWIWVAIVGWALSRRNAKRPAASAKRKAFAIAVITIALHAGYYTFVVGGDHFEYRIYAHLIPLFFVSFAWALGRLRIRYELALIGFAAFIGFSWVIPWTHWAAARGFTSRAETLKLTVPVADRLPAPFRPIGRLFDEEQAWLIQHFVGMRYEEHKALWMDEIATYPNRNDGLSMSEEGFPVTAAPIVGVLGWAYPRLAIIDVYGLNDAVVARTPIDASRERKMAHDRRPPPGYVECFAPNVTFRGGAAVIHARKEPLTSERIVDCESRAW